METIELTQNKVSTMNKSKLNDFIKKYYLSGMTLATKLAVKDKVLSCDFISADQTVMGSIQLKNIDIQDCELGIYQTDKLLDILSVLDEDIKIELEEKSGMYWKLTINDNKKTSAHYLLASLSIIPNPPKLKSLPTFEIKIPITTDLIEKFNKAGNAIKESNIFAFVPKDNKIQMIVNYTADSLANSVVIDTNVEYKESFEALNFTYKALKEVLSANKDIQNSSIDVSTKGLLRVTFSNDEFSSAYYIPKNR